MSAIIRVKRRLEDEPLDALIINCKRCKLQDVPQAETSTVLRFSGTLDSENENVLNYIKQQSKETLESNYKTHALDIKSKIRQEFEASNKENRYKVVNLSRSAIETEHELASKNALGEVTIVDVEAQSESDEKENKEPAKYVYDVYYTNSDDLGEIYEQDLLGIFPVTNELVYGSHRDNGMIDSDDDDTDDSNDENNWRNDYPDEYDEDDVTDQDMINAVNRVRLYGDLELSSEEEQEGFIYSIDSEAAGFEEDVDDSDVNRYGERYARFKARYKDKSDDENIYYQYSDDERDDDDPNVSGYYN